MKTVCALLAITVLSCGLVTAADVNNAPKDVVLRNVKGVGAAKEEAVRNGLFQAVAQVRGVKVGSGDYSFGFHSAGADVDKTPTGKSVEIDAVSVQASGTLNKTEVEGLVKTYEILDEKKLDDGSYQVTLNVWVYSHQPLDKSSRLRLAVMPVRTNFGSYIFAGLTMRADQLAERMEQKLAAALAQTNKFAILDRQHIAEYIHEQNVLFHTAPVEEQARIGQALGADLMLVGTITSADLSVKYVSNEAIAGVTTREYDAHFAFDYRLVVASSRQIKFADTVRLHLETADVKKLVSEWEASDLDYDELVDNLVAMVAFETVDRLSEKLYPPKIASIASDGSVIINQGGDRFAEGTLLEVVKSDKQITDPDTGESLGSAEIPLATIRIDRVMPAMSYCTVVSGDASKLSEGLICRFKPLPRRLEGAKSTVETTPGGGVKLPFD